MSAPMAERASQADVAQGIQLSVSCHPRCQCVMSPLLSVCQVTPLSVCHVTLAVSVSWDPDRGGGGGCDDPLTPSSKSADDRWSI